MKYFAVFAIFAAMVSGLNALMQFGDPVGGINRFGQVRNPGTFPYLVHLQIWKFNDTSKVDDLFRCGGSIIRTNIILTAAHCVVGIAPEKVKANAGIVHTRYQQDSRQSFYARRIVCHENYQDYWHNDIALVFLAASFQKTRYVDTIQIAQPFQYQDSMSITAVGWGLLFNGTWTDWLYRGDFVMLNRTFCAQLIGYIYYEKLLCGVDAKKLQKIGKGDSGGPLVHNNVLVGLTVGAYGDLPGQYNPNIPSLFANVSYYTKWISEKIGYDTLFFMPHTQIEYNANC